MKQIFLLITCVMLTVKLFSQIPTAGLVAYYPFCGNANDISPNAYHGTVFGAQLTADRFGNPNSAYAFNGISNRIDLPPSGFAGRNVYSCSLWMRPTANTSNGYIAYNVGSTTDPYCIGLNYNPPGIFTGCYNNGGNPQQSYVTSSAISGINNWVHLVITRDLASLKLYVNGAMVTQAATANTNNQTVNYGTPPYRAAIGTRSNLQNFFQGDIDDVRIYATVLTQNDVNALYAEQAFMISVNNGNICRGNSFTLVPTGAQTYVYPGGSAVVTPSSTSSYTVVGFNSMGCSAQAVSNVVVNACTGINEQNADVNSNAFLIFPNPGSGNFTVQLNVKDQKQYRFVLKDLQGRIIKGVDLNSVNQQIVNDPPVAAGCYIGELSCEGRIISAQKIVFEGQ